MILVGYISKSILAVRYGVQEEKSGVSSSGVRAMLMGVLVIVGVFA